MGGGEGFFIKENETVSERYFNLRSAREGVLSPQRVARITSLPLLAYYSDNIVDVMVNSALLANAYHKEAKADVKEEIKKYMAQIVEAGETVGVHPRQKDILDSRLKGMN